MILGNYEALNILLAFGANMSLQDNYGNTPLHSAIRNGQRQVSFHLISQGADPYIKNNRGESPLDKAKTNEFRHFIELSVTKAQKAQRRRERASQEGLNAAVDHSSEPSEDGSPRNMENGTDTESNNPPASPNKSRDNLKVKFQSSSSTSMRRPHSEQDARKREEERKKAEEERRKKIEENKRLAKEALVIICSSINCSILTTSLFCRRRKFSSANKRTKKIASAKKKSANASKNKPSRRSKMKPAASKRKPIGDSKRRNDPS